MRRIQRYTSRSNWRKSASNASRSPCAKRRSRSRSGSSCTCMRSYRRRLRKVQKRKGTAEAVPYAQAPQATTQATQATQATQLPIVPIVRRGGIQFPPISIALGDLLLALELLVVLVFDAHRAADVVHDVLVGRWIVAARRLVSDAVRRFPVRVDVARGQCGTCLGVFVVTVLQLAAAAAHCGCRAVEVQRRRGSSLDKLVFVANDPALAIEAGRFPENGYRRTLPARRSRCPDDNFPGGLRRPVPGLRRCGLRGLHCGALADRRPFRGVGPDDRFPRFFYGFRGRPALGGRPFPARGLFRGAPARRLAGAAPSFRWL